MVVGVAGIGCFLYIPNRKTCCMIGALFAFHGSFEMATDVIFHVSLHQAFVPQAIRKKKKLAPKQVVQSKPQQVLIKQSFDGEKTLDGSQQTQVSEIHYENNPKKASDKEDAVLDIHGIPTESGTNKIEKESKESNDNNTQHENNNNEPYLENEPESLRLLHASVTNPYDPHFPNDYLAYRERKKTEQVRKDLQRSALQRLDQQEKLRKKIQEERKKILDSGDLDKIVDVAVGVTGGAGRGRGRGRGVSNLPAWLLKKQQEQKEAGATACGSISRPTDGQFEDYAS